METTSITIMDGPCGTSLYPYVSTRDIFERDGAQFYTLTSVKHTPLVKFSTYKEAVEYMESIDENVIITRKPLFEDT